MTKTVCIAFPGKRFASAKLLAEDLIRFGLKRVVLIYDQDKVPRWKLESIDSRVTLVPVRQSGFLRRPIDLWKYRKLGTPLVRRIVLKIHSVTGRIKMIRAWKPTILLDRHEQFIKNAILDRAEAIETALLGLGMKLDLEDSLVILEGDRTIEMELPFLYLKKRNPKIRIAVVETVRSANEAQLVHWKYKVPPNITSNSYIRRNRATLLLGRYMDNLFYDWHEQVAINKLGLLSEFPWRIGHNSLVDCVILCETEEFAKKSHPYPELLAEKFVFGIDVISEIIVHELRGGNQSHDADMTALMLLPQFLEDSEEFHPFNRRRITRDLRTFLNRIEESFDKVLVSLHPKQRKDTYKNFFEGKKFEILEHKEYFQVLNEVSMVISTESSALRLIQELRMPAVVFAPTYWKLFKQFERINAERNWSLFVTEKDDFSAQDLKIFAESVRDRNKLIEPPRSHKKEAYKLLNLL